MDAKSYEKRINDIVIGGLISVAIGIGHKVGLFQILTELEEPVSLQKLSELSKLKIRYVREWLGCMTAARLVSINDRGYYFIPGDCKPYLGITSLATVLRPMCDASKLSMSCFEQDGPSGFTYESLHEFYDWLDNETATMTVDAVKERVLQTAQSYRGSKPIRQCLDLGCGTGRITLLLAQALPSATVYGIDVSDYSLSKANKIKEEQNMRNVKFENQNGECLPSDWTNKFDLVVLWDVLHDLPDPKRVLTEMRRILRDDGILVVQDPPVHTNHAGNVGSDQAAMLLSISTTACLPNSMSKEPAVGHGIGWGMEAKLSYLESLGWKNIDYNPFDGNAMNFIKGNVKQN